MTGGEFDVAIIGAGPAGLAVAGALALRGSRAVVFEREQPAAAWERHYERLHLHTIRSLSALPGRPIPRRYGRYVAREDFARYLGEYCAHHRIDVRAGAAVGRIDREDGRYRLRIGAGVVSAARVVVATGHNHAPVMPAWASGGRFGGVVRHAAEYRNAIPFHGADVLVAGVGNSGAEIATDLALGGARSVRIAMRTPPHVVPREVLGVPAQLFGVALEHLPAAAGDAISAVITRAVIGDLRRHGLPRPGDGLVSRHHARDAVPVLDVGFVAALKAGLVTVVPPVASLGEDEALLVDGARVRVDAVVAATGYATGLESLVALPGLLDRRGQPLVRAGATAPWAPGLHFIGYGNPLGGSLRRIASDARTIARTLAGGR